MDIISIPMWDFNLKFGIVEHKGRGSFMKQTTVRGALIRKFAFVLLVSFFAQGVLLVAIQISRNRGQTFNALEQSVQAAATAVDLELDRMRTTALNINYSINIRDWMSPRSTAPDQSDETEALSTILTLVAFPNRPVDQIDLYTKGGTRVSAGIRNEVSADSAEAQDWYASMRESAGGQMIFYSETDSQLSRFMTDDYEKRFISLVAENRDSSDRSYSYLEIKQRLTRIISALMNYESNYGERFYFFDRDGTQIYPMEPSIDGLFAVAQALDFPEDIRQTSAGDTGLHFCCAPLNTGSFYIVIAIENAALLRPLWKQILTPVLLTTLMALLSILLANRASRHFTAPLRTMSRQISGIDIEHPTPLPPLETNIVEIRTLHNSFSQMQSTLSEHVNKLLLLQNQEMQSRMLALQAQMNPHFLYNSLAALQAMADEGMNDEIAVMCQSMANILRYISADSAQLVPLADEIRHTVDYLTCMTARYPGDLHYEIDIPEELNAVKVPKLCVQPLVENAIKHAASRRPPYHIRVEGRGDASGYELRIQDNGPGFSREALDTLDARMEEIRRTSVLPSLKIDGMGILNVFIRFSLLYDNRFVFRLENVPDSGARVVIGANGNGTEI